MKAFNTISRVLNPSCLAGILLLVTAFGLRGQAVHHAWNVRDVARGNHQIGSYGVLNDFQVVEPITITALGTFDSEGDGIQGTTVITVQLYQRSRKPHLLLETVKFDAANPGELVGGMRYKQLQRPVTLLPGTYILYASGFDEQNPNYHFELPPAEGVRGLESTQGSAELD